MGQIHLERLTKSFGPTQVIHDLTLTIAEGEFCVFIGPSGCGKSTLLRLIAGLERTTSGTISINGRDVTELNPTTAACRCVSKYALYPHIRCATTSPLRATAPSRVRSQKSRPRHVTDFD